MGGVAGPELASAVSNAGGLGTLALSSAGPEEVAAAVRRTLELTEKPFAVNLLLNRPEEERLEAALDAGTPAISFGWGDPAPFVDRVHAAGALVFATVGSAAEGLRAAESGVDVVVAQGWEAGGHVWGTVATLPLVPAVVDAVAPLPVLAGGGIADGRGIAAVLALGAAGAWIGTRFLAADEAPAHPEYQKRLLAATEADTYYGTLFDVGWPDAPHRVLRNTTVDAWEQAGRAERRPGEGEEVGTGPQGPIPRYASFTPSASVDGDVEAMSMWAGQGVGLVTRTQPAAEIVRELLDEAERVLAALP